MKKLKYSLFGLCACIALFSCEKDENNLGAKVGDDKKLVGAAIIDTFKVITYSNIEDTIKSSEQISPQLGAYNSDQVGLVQSALFVTLKPDSFGSNLPKSDFKVDSLFLTLDIVDVYGKSVNQEFDVYRLDQQVNKDSIYYAFNTLGYTELIGTITINATDSNTYSFPLDTAFANQLVLADSTDMSSESDFSSFFKGIAIVPKTNTLGSNEGAIYSLNRTGIKMHMQYHSTLLNPTKTYDTEIIFDVESDKLIFTNATHDFTGSEVEPVLNDSTLGQYYFYTQGLIGSIGKVSFPSLQAWYLDTNNYLINKFEFTVYVEDNSTFTLPTELMLTYKNSFGGTSFTTSIINTTSNSYTFTISPSELDTQLKSGTIKNMDFTLLPTFPGSKANQVKIHGGEGVNPPKLKIHYTIY
tara:strand:- start:3640 stop:4875 length:1236 start_codon:yes stop_codon:yes gene_type:complete